MLSERQKEAMESSTSMCVTAGAGAGKTHTLVEKYLHLVESGVNVSEILALTFTEKAAAEMKYRVRGAVMKLPGERWDRVKDEINWCKISTFHAFCANVIREYPLETGMSPSSHVLEEVERRELLEEAMDRLLSPPIKEKVDMALVRLLMDVSRSKLADVLRYIFERRAGISMILDSFDTKDQLLELWKGMVRKGQRRAVSCYFDDEEFMAAVEELRALASRYGGGKDSGCKYLASISHHIETLVRCEDDDAVCRALAGIRSVKVSKNAGSKPVFGTDLDRFRGACAAVQEVFKRNGTESLDDGAEELTDAAASLLMDIKLVFNEYQEIVREMKREANTIDFEDMIATVHDLFVKEPVLVKEEFTSRYRYILVDEFQDTDAVQSDIIWRMAGGSDAKERLFIVGDPKQSIYLFRHVDVSMFKEFQDRIVGQLGGKPIHLDTNYRSSPQLIDFVNHVFGNLMREAKERWEFEYQEMKVSDERKRDRGSIELLLLPDADGSEAEFIARRVQEIVESRTNVVYWSPDGKKHIDEPRPACYGDIAILLRAKTRLREFEEELDRYGVPYRVHQGLGFYEEQEIIDLRNLLAFLNNEEDDLSLYGTLRSPYFAFSDEQLFHMVCERNGPLWKRIRGYCATVEDQRAHDAVHRLERWLHYAHRLTVPQLLSMVYRESGIFAVYGALPGGDLKIANLEKLLSMVRNAHSSGFLTLTEFERWLRLSIESGLKEGLAKLAGGDNSVKIMTVHAAKGLEFPIVFVPEMNFFRRDDSSLVMYGEGTGLAVDAPDASDGYKMKATLPKRIIAQEAARKGSAESKRLLYVALTRAKDHLFMCGHMPDEKEQERELWINWIMETTSLVPEGTQEGQREVRPGLAVIVRTDPESIDAVERPPLAEERLTPEELREFIVPRKRIEVTPSKPILSPSKASHENMEDGIERTKPPEIVCTGGMNFCDLPTVRGTIIHEVLSGKDAAVVLRRYGITDKAKEADYSAMRERLLAEPMMKNARSVFSELAFMARIDDDIYKGRIDMMVQKEDGSWLVIDHKTGRFEGELGENKIEEYSKQMRIYQVAIEDLVKKKVSSVLYMADEQRFVLL